MRSYRYLLILIFLSLPGIVCAQPAAAPIDFSRVDSLAMTVKYENDIHLLTKQLTSPFPDQLFKARAIFRWITDNIAYDYKFYNRYGYKGKDPKTYYCRDDDSAGCELKKQVWENEYISKLLDKRKGVCQGYAMLFKKMCDIAGIEAEVIPGYVRTEYYEIGTMGELDHAWNAVKLNGDWYVLDATWAAGGCAKDEDGKLLPFKKQFDNYYWLTPPDEFARNHFPENGTKVLPANYTKEKFMSNAYYAPGVISGIKVIAPASGIINTKKGDTIRFKMVYDAPLQALQINSNVFQNPDTWMWEYITKRKMVRQPDTLAIKKLQYIKYKRQGDTFEFAHVVKDNTLEYLDIVFDTRRVVRFNVRVNR